MPDCPFCVCQEHLPEAEKVTSFFEREDLYPVSPGHTLIISKDHVKDIGDLNRDEVNYLMVAIELCMMRLENTHSPDGFNIGFNQGEAGGQTIPHFHVHVIPRYNGDMEDPRGGVRHVIPEKGNYLK